MRLELSKSMLFPTYQFLIFFILIFSLGISLKKQTGIYKYFLLLSSLIFYGFWGINLLILLIINIAINYWFVVKVTEKSKLSKTFLKLGIIFNCLFLGIFKYYNFFTDEWFAFLSVIQVSNAAQAVEIIAPVGVSFYTFRIISHLVDCDRQEFPIPTWIDYAVYITYFPQIASGPIARAKHFYQQLNSSQKYDYKIEEVIVLVLSGLFKKYTLASFLFNFTQLPFASPDQYSRLDLLLAMVAYSCLIYVDFSGYSDLSNAISSVLGFQPIPNFNCPYRSVSLQEFWRRWHISLSEWLRDYLYIPLGGNRFGQRRQSLNLFLTMLIAGVWHGAGLNFVIWGGIHGLGLMINHWFKQSNLSKKIVLAYSGFSLLFSFINWSLTFGFVCLSWVFFQSPSLEIAFSFLQNLLFSRISEIQFNYWQLYAVIFIVLVLINYDGEQISALLIRLFSLRNIFFRVVLLSGFVYGILMLGPNSVPPFIYFNF